MAKWLTKRYQLTVVSKGLQARRQPGPASVITDPLPCAH
jgi:hypothetical protein